MDIVTMVQAFYKALNAKDNDALMTFFTNNAVIVEGENRWEGKEQLRSIIEYATEHDDWVEVSNIQEAGNTATWDLHVRRGDTEYDLNIKAVIENSKIASFTFL